MKLAVRLLLYAAILAYASLNAACSVVSGGGVYPISDRDRQSVDDKFHKLRDHVPYIQPTIQSPHVKLYKVAFDGTLNDRARVPVQEQKTVVAHIADLIDVAGDVKYYRGPGMQGKSIDWLDAMFGTSSIKVAEEAAADYATVARRWRADDPEVDIRVFVTGFSRGAATARHFMNLVAAADSSLRKVAPNQVPARFYALLFDTVSTGQTDKMKLGLPPELDYLVHFVALDESRPLFTPVIDVMPDEMGGAPILGFGGLLPDRINLVVMPGAHADIGSSYQRGVGNEYLVLTEQILYLMGLYKKSCWDVADDYYVEGKHDSRGLLDKWFGVHAPNVSASHDRRYIPSPTKVPPDQFASLMLRLDALQLAQSRNIDGMEINRRKKPGLTLWLKRQHDALQVQGFEENVRSIDPDSFAFVTAHGVRTLTFRRIQTPHNMNVLHFDDALWRRLPEEKVAVLNITRLEWNDQHYLATFVDNELVQVVPSAIGKDLVLQPTPARCEISADGQPVRTLKHMIIR
jgi:hypothetical protein